MNKIKKLLNVGDFVYLANGGVSAKVTEIQDNGFIAGGNITLLKRCGYYIF